MDGARVISTQGSAGATDLAGAILEARGPDARWEIGRPATPLRLRERAQICIEASLPAMPLHATSTYYSVVGVRT